MPFSSQLLADRLAPIAGGENGLDWHRRGGGEGFGHVLGLRIFPLGKAEASPKVGPAAVEQLGQPLRATPGIDLVEQPQQGAGA